MKVLWFTNIPMPAMRSDSPIAHASSGGWMVSLLEKLKSMDDIKLGVACVYPGANTDSLNDAGVSYFSIPQGSHRRIFYFKDLDSDNQFLKRCIKVVHEWNADIIHIHGTERPYGLITAIKDINSPVVISIQGLVSECAKWRYSFGDIKLAEIFKMHKPLNTIRGIGPLFNYIINNAKGKREREIIKKNQFFFGRTLWDRAHVKALRPGAKYYNLVMQKAQVIKNYRQL